MTLEQLIKEIKKGQIDLTTRSVSIETRQSELRRWALTNFLDHFMKNMSLYVFVSEMPSKHLKSEKVKRFELKKLKKDFKRLGPIVSTEWAQKELLNKALVDLEGQGMANWLKSNEALLNSIEYAIINYAEAVYGLSLESVWPYLNIAKSIPNRLFENEQEAFEFLCKQDLFKMNLWKMAMLEGVLQSLHKIVSGEDIKGVLVDATSHSITNNGVFQSVLREVYTFKHSNVVLDAPESEI